MPTRPVALRVAPDAPSLDAIERAWARGDAVLPLDAALSDVAADGLARRLRAREPVRDGTALVIATSGTTGAPKGVVLSHEALTASARASLDRLGAEPGERWHLRLPLHHVAGILVLVRARMLGTDVVLEGGAEYVSLVPTQVVRATAEDLSGYRRILVGGAAPPPGLPAHATVTYGMTETCGGCVYDGVPLDGVEVRLRTDGRIAIAGPVLASGYRDGTPLPLEDGFLVTNDLGRWAPDGRLEVLGRVDDVIVTGGENVLAPEVARVLVEHPAVADAYVAGREDPEWGQRVVAWCVPADPDHPPTLDELRASVAERLGRPAAPREIRMVAALPRTALGKVTRPPPR